jgi:hypothetical protein
MKKAPRIGPDEAEAMALSALAFLAGDGGRLSRFLALTGMGPEALRAGAGRAETLAAVLDHVLQDESLLLAFTANHGIDPLTIAPAHEILVRAATGGDRR